VLARCPACSARFPIAGGGDLRCPFCGVALVVSIERAASAPIEPSVEPAVKNTADTPWEAQGRVQGFFLTAWRAMRSPVRFFRELSTDAVGGAPSFALMILAPAVIIQATAFLLLERGVPPDAESLVRYAGLVLLASSLSIAYLGTFYQLAASVFSRRRVAVSATVRAVCFGFAPMILAVVPVAGLAIGLLWSLLLHAIALREIHGLTGLKSFVVVLIPIALVAVKLW
jgi:hypothetical protein